MKVKSSILLWFVTLATFVLGLFLPNIVYMVQSKGLASSSQQYSVETVQLETTKSAPMKFISLLFYSFQTHHSVAVIAICSCGTCERMV